MAHMVTVCLIALIASASCAVTPALGDDSIENSTLAKLQSALLEASAPLSAVGSAKVFEWNLYPCDDRFSAALLNRLRRSTASEIATAYEQKMLNTYDAGVLRSAVASSLEALDATLYNLTQSYHNECIGCTQSRGFPCCQMLRAEWMIRVMEEVDKHIRIVCDRAYATAGVSKSMCGVEARAYNPSSDMARLLRCEAQCTAYVNHREAICTDDAR